MTPLENSFGTGWNLQSTISVRGKSQTASMKVRAMNWKAEAVCRSSVRAPLHFDGTSGPSGATPTSLGCKK